MHRLPPTRPGAYGAARADPMNQPLSCVPLAAERPHAPPARWRWDRRTGALHLDGAEALPAPPEVVRALLQADVHHHLHQEAVHFHRDHLISHGGTPLRLGVHGTAVRGVGGAASMHGTVCALPEPATPPDTRADPLTGLPTRAAFLRRLEALRAQGRAHGVLCLDLDNLQALNDGLGHDLGDLLLRWTADRLRQALDGHLLARVGSDEFAVLFEGPHARGEVEHLAERLLETLTSSVLLAEHLIYPSAKAGLAWTGPAGPVDVLRDAQSALARAKASRTARMVTFTADMRRRHLAALRLDVDLRHAVATDQLDLHFQPIVSLTDGRIEGFEALLRWHHPERGPIPPDTFVPQAERNGLILPIGQWALRRALRALRRLRGAFPSLHQAYVSVNLSPVQLRQADLVDQVRGALGATALPPSALRLELTEHTVTSQGERTLDVLHRLQRLGVQLLLDDFGTGYSALQYLVRIPADALKVDRAFVADLGQDPRTSRVVGTIVDLARSLGMRVVAEGVETQAQLAAVRALGIDTAQGFLLGAPTAEADLPRLVPRDPRQPVA